MSDRMVDKLSKLLNQAEQAPEGSPERETFMEKALQLSQAYSIDLAVARSHQAKKERVEQPERRTFQVGRVGQRTKNKNAHFVDLMLAICEQNDIRCTISGSRVYVYGTGMPSDLDMAERLFAILSVQMVAEADAGLKRGDNLEPSLEPVRRRVEIPEDQRAWGQHDGSWEMSPSFYYDERDEKIEDGLRHRYNEDGYGEWVKSYPPPRFRLEPVLDENGQPVMETKMVSKVDGRVWRANFYLGFVHRTRMRLWEARQAALKEAGIDEDSQDSPGALALRDKSKEVQDAYEENEKLVLASGRSYDGAQVNAYSRQGLDAGDEAGRRARHGNEKDLGRQTKSIGGR